MVEMLLFQLYGPLAAWGEPAVGEYRPTASHPGKSQIAGLLGAALGLSRDRETELQALVSDYGLAVRVNAIGELLRDYHTTQVPPARKGNQFYSRREELEADDLNTILSQRDYRVEAAWTCLLWLRTGTPLWQLGQLADALRKPRFTLYLGRKSCPPALPLNPKIIKANSLKAAFNAYSIDEQLKILTSKGPHHYFWEEPLLDGLKSGFSAQEKLWVVPRRDLPINRRLWQFATRDEYHAIA